MMERRQFLGAAAALSALTAAGSTTSATATDTTDDTPREADEGTEAVFSSFSTDICDYETTYEIFGYQDDPNAAVCIHIGTEFGVFALDLDRAQARDVIQELQAALVEADQ